MLPCNVIIRDKHFQEMHHALGCPWPDEVMGETYRNYFACDPESSTADRMRASTHWSGGSTKFESSCFHVSDVGRKALKRFMDEHVDTPARFAITYRHHDGTTIVPARTRSAARYAAYQNADIDWPFMEFAAEIKSIKKHSAANVVSQPS